jgi:hypothetical protein
MLSWTLARVRASSVNIHKHKYTVYIPLKPPFLIPSDNTALRVRDLITPSDYSMLLVLPGRYRDNENEAIFRWAKTPFLLLFLFVNNRRSSCFWMDTETKEWWFMSDETNRRGEA